MAEKPNPRSGFFWFGVFVTGFGVIYAAMWVLITGLLLLGVNWAATHESRPPQ